MSAHYGLIELVLVFGAVLALAVWDLMATKRSYTDTAEPPAPSSPAKTPPGSKAPPRAKAGSKAKGKPRTKPSAPSG